MGTILKIKTVAAYAFPLALLICLTLLNSCKRRPLEDEIIGTALIPVSVIWDDAQLDPDNDPGNDVYSASVWLFSKDGSKKFGDRSYKEYKLSNPRGGTIEVPIGRYSVIIFNNTVKDFSSNVAFRGTDKYETFEYYALNDTRKGYVRSEGETLIREPDILAGWHMDDYEVTADMVRRSRKPQADAKTLEALKTLVDVRAQLLTPRVHVIVHVQGLCNASSASAALKGMGSSVFLATGYTASPPVSYVFPLNNRQYYTGSGRDGTIEASFNSFGPLHGQTGAQYGLQMSFTLQAPCNGSTTYPTPPASPFSFDVTNQVYIQELQLRIDLEIGLGTGGGTGGSEGEVVLPDTGSTGGFGVGVSDWGEVVDIPVDKK